MTGNAMKFLAINSRHKLWKRKRDGGPTHFLRDDGMVILQDQAFDVVSPNPLVLPWFCLITKEMELGTHPLGVPLLLDIISQMHRLWMCVRQHRTAANLLLSRQVDTTVFLCRVFIGRKGDSFQALTLLSFQDWGIPGWFPSSLNLPATTQPSTSKPRIRSPLSTLTIRFFQPLHYGPILTPPMAASASWQKTTFSPFWNVNGSSTHLNIVLLLAVLVMCDGEAEWVSGAFDQHQGRALYSIFIQKAIRVSKTHKNILLNWYWETSHNGIKSFWLWMGGWFYGLYWCFFLKKKKPCCCLMFGF